MESEVVLGACHAENHIQFTMEPTENVLRSEPLAA